MRVFVTGASGFIGSAVVPELVKAGHQVTGLARSDASAEKLRAAGVGVLRGDLADLDTLRAGAKAADGVVHLGFVHDFANFAAATETDRNAVEAMCEQLVGTNKPFAFASGVLGLAPGRLATEADSGSHSPRQLGVKLAHSYAAKGVRTVEVRFSPTVHDRGDHGFMHLLIEIAKRTGVAGYLGDGSNRWSAVHRADAASLVRLGLEQAPAESKLHAVAEEGIPLKQVAELFGKHLNVPVRSIPAEEAAAYFGFFNMFMGFDSPVSSARTQQLLGWKPTGIGLLADLDANYFS